MGALVDCFWLPYIICCDYVLPINLSTPHLSNTPHYSFNNNPFQHTTGYESQLKELNAYSEKLTREYNEKV